MQSQLTANEELRLASALERQKYREMDRALVLRIWTEEVRKLDPDYARRTSMTCALWPEDYPGLAESDLDLIEKAQPALMAAE